MNFRELRDGLSTQTKTLIRKVDSLKVKSVQSSFGIKFNKTLFK